MHLLFLKVLLSFFLVFRVLLVLLSVLLIPLSLVLFFHNLLSRVNMIFILVVLKHSHSLIYGDQGQGHVGQAKVALISAYTV